MTPGIRLRKSTVKLTIFKTPLIFSIFLAFVYLQSRLVCQFKGQSIFQPTFFVEFALVASFRSTVTLFEILKRFLLTTEFILSFFVHPCSTHKVQFQPIKHTYFLRQEIIESTPLFHGIYLYIFLNLNAFINNKINVCCKLKNIFYIKIIIFF